MAEWNTRVEELGMNAETAQLLRKSGIEDFEQLTTKSLRELSEMGLDRDQISEVFLAVKRNMK